MSKLTFNPYAIYQINENTFQILHYSKINEDWQGTEFIFSCKEEAKRKTKELNCIEGYITITLEDSE